MAQYEYCILCEKPSALKTFAKALGGKTGIYHGHSYCLTNSVGHILELSQPPEQVKDPKLKKKLAAWNLKYLPWDYENFRWQKELNKRVNRVGDLITNIKKTTQQADKFVIATDNDPFGEGDLIAWEIINYVGWHGPVYRLKFEDSVPSIQEGFDNLVPIASQAQHGAYQMAYARQRFDFLSMQLTRAATKQAEAQDYDVPALRMGRLKSVILKLIAYQNKRHEDYIKKSFYEVRYRDANGNVFKRALKDDDPHRFEKKADGEADLIQYAPDTVVHDQGKLRARKPPRLIDLGTLGGRLAKQGYKTDEVLNVYQKLYEAGYISYPRTEDKGITQAQFDELLPHVDAIAQAVGVNPQLLTQRTARKEMIDPNAEHGANRPMSNVPSGPEELTPFDEACHAKSGCAWAIYTTLARSYLAMLCDNYRYRRVSAQLSNHPDFTAQIDTPESWGWKAVFSVNEEKDKQLKKASKEFAITANPFVYQGCNSRPKLPTSAFIMRYLKKHNIGTGATRLQTLTDMHTGKGPKEFKVQKDNYLLTPLGRANAAMLQGTMIANTKATEKLYQLLHDIGKHQAQPQQVFQYADKLITHDLDQFAENAALLRDEIGDIIPRKPIKKKLVPKEKVEVQYQGKPVQMNAKWSDHTFTPDELTQLSQGKQISFVFTSKKGAKYRATGYLDKYQYKGKTVYGFVVAKKNGRKMLEPVG